MSTRSDEAVFTGSALPDTDTSVELSFGLDVDDVFSSRISEVTCLETERDVGERKTKGPAREGHRSQLPGLWNSIRGHADTTTLRGASVAR